MDTLTQPACFDSHPECPACRGSGFRDGWGQPQGSPKCPTCAGYGWVLCADCRRWQAGWSEAFEAQPTREHRAAWMLRQVIGRAGSA